MIKPWHIIAVWTALFFFYGQQAFITSSEFWPVFASKNILSFSPSWASLFMKPLFNLLLSMVHYLPLTDVQHLKGVKTIFAFNGAAQILLIYFIFKAYQPTKPWLAVALTVLITLSPFYLKTYFQIRSDQLALTLFLVFLLLNFTTFQFKSAWNILFLFAFPLIGFKHIYFSFLALLVLKIKETFSFLKTSLRFERYYIYVLFGGLLIWTANLAIPSFTYFSRTVVDFENNFGALKLFFKFEFLLILLSLGAFCYLPLRAEFMRRGYAKLFLLPVAIVFLLLLHPQKFDFFIGSFVPILFLLAGFLLFSCLQQNPKKIIWGLALIFAFEALSVYKASQQIKLITSYKTQLATIHSITKIFAGRPLTYIDGMGILPRQRNLGCFISPDDYESNQSCLDLVNQHKPDVVILTTRLASYLTDLSLLTKANYVEQGANFYIKKELAGQSPADELIWVPPVLIFGSDDLL
ncbi:MAG: hypothetical protein H7061_08390 [Bdellovibrionaceae bacterium]|nr:hypothetical protein [Bdellovibrio sp.]